MAKTNHVSYYINVGQTIGVIGSLALGYYYLRIEAEKAGLQHKSFVDVVRTDIRKIRDFFQL